MNRFFDKVNKTETCWNWTASLDHKGYGRFKLDGKARRAHRVSYELLIGKIPDGLTVDHLCKNRNCVNPNHFELVSLEENSRRGVLKLAEKKLEKTHCKNGHEYNKENTYIDKNGWRNCRVCRRKRRVSL